MSEIATPAPDDPGLAPPPGVSPYFYSPFTLQPYNAVTIAGCTIVTTIMVLARMYTKQFVLKKLNWEDC